MVNFPRIDKICSFSCVWRNRIAAIGIFQTRTFCICTLLLKIESQSIHPCLQLEFHEMMMYPICLFIQFYDVRFVEKGDIVAVKFSFLYIRCLLILFLFFSLFTEYSQHKYPCRILCMATQYLNATKHVHLPFTVTSVCIPIIVHCLLFE